jgi:glycine/D-amino acid oxidase-like deaminating enzyme
VLPYIWTCSVPALAGALVATGGVRIGLGIARAIGDLVADIAHRQPSPSGLSPVGHPAYARPRFPG